MADDTAMLWGVKFYNDMLMQAGPLGNVQSELLFRKDKSTFTFQKGWAFPRRVYFNGDNCVMPPPYAYPYLPNAGLRENVSLLMLMITILLPMASRFACVWEFSIIEQQGRDERNSFWLLVTVVEKC